MKSLRSRVAVVVALFVFFIFTNNINADNTLFSMNCENIEDAFLKEIIYYLCIENNDGFLYFNEQTYKPTNMENGMYQYYFLLDGVSYQITANLLTYKIDISYAPIYSQSSECWFSLRTVNGVDTIYVYPNLIETNNYYTLTGSLIDEFVYFPEIEMNYSNSHDSYNVELSFLLDKTNDVLLVNAGSEELRFKVNHRSEKQFVYLETYVQPHILASDYVSRLAKYSLKEAKEVIYPNSDISEAARNEKIILTNSKSGLSYQTSISQFISYMKRTGQEMYDPNYDQIIQVVCQYNDDACLSMRNNQRTYNVFGQNYEYEKPTVYQDVIFEKDYEHLLWSDWYNKSSFDKLNLEMIDVEKRKMFKYGHLKWSDYLYSYNEVLENELTRVSQQYRYLLGEYTPYSDYIYDKSIIDSCDGLQKVYKKKTFYQKSKGSWSQYSDYSSYYDSSCLTNDDCQMKTTTKYARSVGQWSTPNGYYYDQDSYALTVCKTNEDCWYETKTMYALVKGKESGQYSNYLSSCQNGDDYKCQTYYKYLGKKGNITTTLYDSNYYALNSTINGYKVIDRTMGYRKAYLKFEEPTSFNLDTCQATKGKDKCFYKTKYALKYRKWSDYSKPIYDSCVDNSHNKSGVTYRCLSSKQYAYSYKQWSNYSDNLYDTCLSDDLTRCKATEKYAIKELKWYSETDWLNNTIDDNNIIKIQKRYKYQTAEVIDVSISNTLPQDVYLIDYGDYYRFSYPKSKEKIEETMGYKIERLGIKEHVTENEIFELAKEIATYKAQVDYIKNNSKLTKAVFDNNKDSLTMDENIYLDFLNRRMFVSDIYVMGHWRAVGRNLDVLVDEANGVLLTDFNTVEEKTYHSKLDKQSNGRIRVVYIDPSNPMGKYQQIPLNWLKQEDLIKKIENASKGTIVIKLTKDDLEKMKAYIENGGDNLLKDFKYIFTNG